MDPWICLFAEEDSALLLDCRAERHEVVPIPDGLGLIVVDSGARHDLAAGEYERRRAECEAAVEGLRAAGFGLRNLRDLPADDLDRATAALDAPLDRRARHVVTENARTLRAADALRAGDLAAFGRLLNDSHESLRTDYDVSTSELDTLVEIALSVPGVFGARMTGGGFGGCTVTAVEAERAEPVAAGIAGEYARRTGNEGRARVVTPSGAAWVAGSRRA
jgi:galactokinase